MTRKVSSAVMVYKESIVSTAVNNIPIKGTRIRIKDGSEVEIKIFELAGSGDLLCGVA